MAPAPQTASRQRELGGSFKARTRREAGISISDMNHHVTEAIGDMYGDDDDWKRESIGGRPLSFMPSPTSLTPETDDSYFSNSYGTPGTPSQAPGRTGTLPPAPRPQLQINGGAKKAQTMPVTLPSQKNGDLANSTPPSPSHSLRENRHLVPDPNQKFPLSDIDYSSDPAAITKELNNLQALRRMSMDVGNTSDPDLPSFGGLSIMPSVAPRGDDDEDDPSRLFWVPARVHPELAPMEFKSFLENRVKTIKRRSGESVDMLSPESMEISGSMGSLRRKKSMLSRQIDNSGGRGAVGYQDGADKLERRKSTLSQSSTGPELKLSDLTELDELVKDPTKAMQKLALERGSYENSSAEVPASEDMPILPAAPGIGLRRSTHTTYRKGSLRRGERVPYSKRAAQAGIRAADTDGDDSASSIGAPNPGQKRVFSEPVTENFSRPGRRRPAVIDTSITTSDTSQPRSQDPSTKEQHQPEPQQEKSDNMGDTKRAISLSLRPKPAAPPSMPVPQIIETPPAEEDSSGDSASDGPKISPQYPFPERSSSYSVSAPSEPPPRSNRRPQMQRQQSSMIETIPKAAQADNNMTNNDRVSNDLAHSISSNVPVNNATTDDLTFIPIAPAAGPSHRAPEPPKLKKSSERDRDDNDSIASTSSKRSWFSLRSDGSKKDKKREKAREKEQEREEEQFKRTKVKAGLDKVHDSARLDVLQQAVEHTAHRGRESLLLDRESIDNKLTSERSKESNRKSGKEEKEKKEGLFGSIFGGRKKADRESGGKKGNSSLRPFSPEPPKGPGMPDIDYNWTRFSLLEERAIYRMAHLKLANPRRPLHSQVLLSNFMYGYLAKVQQMNPNVQIPQSAAQKKQMAEEKKAKEAEQKRQEEAQRQEQYQYDYHQGLTDYAESSQDGARRHGEEHEHGPQGAQYVDDSQIFHSDQQDGQRSYNERNQSHQNNGQDNGQNAYGDQGHYSQQQEQYYQYDDNQGDDNSRQNGGRDDMW